MAKVLVILSDLDSTFICIDWQCYFIYTPALLRSPHNAYSCTPTIFETQSVANNMVKYLQSVNQSNKMLMERHSNFLP